MRSRFFVAVACLAGSGMAQAIDSYDYSNNQLTAPSVAIGNATYTNMVVTGGGLAGDPHGSAALGTEDTYDPATNALTVPAVEVYDNGLLIGTFYNVVTYVGSLVSVGGVSGADTLGSPDSITIPFLHVKEGIVDLGVFRNVTITNLSLADPPVLSTGGGMPTAEDTWDIATGQLHIAAIKVGNLGVFTNPTIDLDLRSGNPAYAPYVSAVGAGTPAAGVPAVYTVDATSTLRAYDVSGNALASAKLPAGAISNINGGGITTDASNVYVTTGNPDGVLAFNKVDLAPVTLPSGSFGGTFVPRGIAYDSSNGQFYIGNGGSNVTIYGSSGESVASIGSNVYGPSGVAYDVLSETLWVANFTGGSGTNPTYGVAEFNGNGSGAASLNPKSSFLAPSNPTRELPYSIAYCQPSYTAASGLFGPTYIVVGFLSDNTQTGSPEAGIYTTAGALVAGLSPQLNSGEQPNGLSCSSTGTIYVASNGGLLIYNTTGVAVSAGSGAFAGMTPPIYGVHADY